MRFHTCTAWLEKRRSTIRSRTALAWREMTFLWILDTPSIVKKEGRGIGL